MYLHNLVALKIKQLASMVDYTDEALLKRLGERIRTVRKEGGLSLRDLAFKIGMEPSNLSVIENGRSNPQILTYARIASALNVGLTDLFDFHFDFQGFADQPQKYQARKHEK
jgi:transcriptional regulator with XRE-family HTH domain